MNNNIIKSLRRTLLCTVAAAAVTIGFTACADETFTTQNTNAPANGNGYKFNIPANIGGVGTRAIAYNREYNRYDKTFETSDRIFVWDVNKNAKAVKTFWSGDWDITFLQPDANGQTANLCGEIDAFVDVKTWDVITPDVGDELMLFYNTDKYNTDVLSYIRDFSSDNNNKIADYAIAKVNITAIENGVIKTGFSNFVNPQSIYKINFTDIGDGVKFKKIDILSEKNNLVTEYFPLNNEEQFGLVSYTYEGEGTNQRELTFMLRYSPNPNNYYNQNGPSTSGDVFSFRALDSNGHYYIGQKEVTVDLENGMYYQADVKMEDGGMAMKVTNTTTGEIYTPSTYCSVFTNTADYVAEYNGYGTCIEWYGGNDANHTLTIKNLTMNNSRDVAIAVKTDYEDRDNTKVHKLVLDGDNTFSVTGGIPSLTVQDNCSLIISSASTGTGKLILKAVDVPALSLWNEATVTIESGEVTLDGSLGGENNSCVIGVNGKLRILTEKIYPNTTDCIKAVDGYVLIANKDGDYTVFTVIKDDGSGLAKSIWVTPAITIGLDSDTQGWDGDRPNVIVMPENTEDKSVTWKSSDPNIIEYANGELYPRHFGVATLTVTTNDGSNLSAECIVTVKPLAAIMYNNYEVNVTPESKPFINPLTIKGHYTSITYTSSDESIATVNASTGEVTIAAGATVGQKVQIRAHVTWKNDGEYFYPQWNETAYTVNIVAPTGQGQREDYGPGEW